jgi:hypothetical protein
MTEEAFGFEVVVIPHTLELATAVKSEIERATRLDYAADSPESAA